MTLTADDLKATFDAFNRHDIAGVMTHFAEDCVFTTVAGPDVFGTRIEGREAIARAFVGVWTAMPDAQWAGHSHFVQGDRAVSEWTFIGTDAAGNRTEAQAPSATSSRAASSSSWPSWPILSSPAAA